MNYTCKNKVIKIVTRTCNSLCKTDAFNDIGTIILEYMTNVFEIKETNYSISIDILLRAVYDLVQIKSVSFDNKTYYENGSECNNKPVKTRDTYDPYIYCLRDGDNCKFSDHDEKIIQDFKVNSPSYKYGLIYPEVRKRFKKEEIVTYNMVIENDVKKHFDIDQLHDEYEDLKLLPIPNFDNIVDIDFQDLDIVSFKKYLQLTNKRGVNKDHRGSNHCHLELTFYNTYILGQSFTFHDFAEAFYKVKSHKFTNWYESVCGYEMISLSDDKLECQLAICHGS
jgi:hypothetical protein